MPVGGCFRKSIGFAGVGPLVPKFGGSSSFGVYLCDRFFENGNVFGNLCCGYAIENTHNKHFTYQS
jgi:hypothetical protein